MFIESAFVKLSGSKARTRWTTIPNRILCL